MSSSSSSSSCNNIRESSGACLRGCSPLVSGLLDPRPGDPSAMSETALFRRNFVASTVSSLLADSRFTNHESLPSSQDSFASFTRTYLLYDRTSRIDEIRATEYCHLGSRGGHVCLDYVGLGLFSYSQKLSGNFGGLASSPLDPAFFEFSLRSVELSSWISHGVQESEFEAKIRRRIMSFMNVSESDYAMVFVPNQASAFKIVAESYAFQSNGRSLLTVYDHKNEAIEAMVGSSKKRGAHERSVDFLFPSMRLRSDKLKKTLLGNKGLFVIPVQSRLTGSHYSYLWMGLARENKWHVLLDASALGPKEMDTLGLSLFKPDFLVCSFYKVFGDDPSGFGCLFVKRSSMESAFRGYKPSKSIGILTLRPAGQELGSGELSTDVVSMAATRTNESEIEEIEAPVKISEPMTSEDRPVEGEELELKGLDHADEIGVVLIKCRMRYLTNWLVNALLTLVHPGSDDKLSLVRIYGPRVRFERGPGIAFNVFDWKGEKIDPTFVQKLGDRHGISLSIGDMDNIWFCSKKHEEHERLIETGTSEHFRGKESRRKKNKNKKIEFEKGLKVVSASIGFLTNFEDVHRVWEFVARFLDADFVEKERWRYDVLNLKTVEV
ncbi:hypothetical protein MLD38_036569 [Melastoma candidum]|uniref:Uncharacterized protein n=1 Tax=Melastoma candidum TaxID=119954 RepID=A0ACB9LJM1_9MYRT|nr:hypothetical protein MLD38_036569 [Melastoma candidum]